MRARTVLAPLVSVTAFVSLLLAGCGDDGTGSGASRSAGAQVHDAWIRSSTSVSDAAAVYATISAGAAGDMLVAVTVPATVAAKAELHETASDAGAMGSGATGGGMLMMHSVASIAVPANGTTTLKPGGLHVMLLDLAAPLRNGDAVPVTFTFHEAGSITVQAAVRDS